MKVGFSKIHGIGNDFIVVSELSGEAVPEARKAAFAKRFCRRKFSIGADGVLFLQKSAKYDFMMRIFNPDGSEAENCVNGVRCASFRYFRETGKESFNLETLAGPVEASIEASGQTAVVSLEVLGKREYDGEKSLSIGGEKITYSSVDVGNPHAVVFIGRSPRDYPVLKNGPAVENHADFAPAKTNVEFVKAASPTHLLMRVWERGVGETMACGSGSIAAVISACEKGLADRDEWVKVEQPGGTLEIRCTEDSLSLKGPAEMIFEGEAEW